MKGIIMATEKANEYKGLLDEGYTQAQIARMFGIPRQNVNQVLKFHGMLDQKETKPLPFIWYRGVKYSISDYGFFDPPGILSLPQAVWFNETGEHPETRRVIHIDGNPENNAIENLELVEKE
jgi:hypothetical protein